MEEKEVTKSVPKTETKEVRSLFNHHLHYEVVINGMKYTFIAPFAGDHLSAKQAAFSFLGQIETVCIRAEELIKEQQKKEADAKKASETVK